MLRPADPKEVVPSSVSCLLQTNTGGLNGINLTNQK